MKTIEERADAYVGHPFEIDEFSSTTAKRQAFIDGAKEQKKLTLEAFDDWLCRNSWITRDENNRQALAELRNIIMSRKNDLIPILKNVPIGTILYSPIFGDVTFEGVDERNGYIEVREEYGIKRFRHDGTYLMREHGECLLFPSKECRDWSKFNVKNN